MTFDTTENGYAYVNLTPDRVQVAYNMTHVPFILTGNATIFIHEFIPTDPSALTAIGSHDHIDLSWTVGSQADKTYIEWNNHSTWAMGEGTFLYNDSGSSTIHSSLYTQDTYYYQAWSWNETDGFYSATYDEAYGSTQNIQPTKPIDEQPVNNTEYLSVYNSYMNVTSTDADNDEIKMEFYWGNGTAIAFMTVDSGVFANLTLPDYIDPDWLGHNITYYWYALANDSYGGLNQSAVFNFHTSYAWDIDENGLINIIDVSGIVVYYGDGVVAGSIGADINNDAIVDALDVSGFVGHYGESYI
jgi:hypothetical protein